MADAQELSPLLRRLLPIGRWVVLAGLGFSLIVSETIEHNPLLYGFSPAYDVHLVLYGLLLPLAGGFLIHRLTRVESQLLKQRTEEAERQRLVRDLHDSLGQDLSYLCLKVQQLADDLPQEANAIKPDLDQVRTVANAAYESLRGKLLDLQPSRAADVEAALREYAATVSQRSNLVVEVKTSGQPHPLPPRIYREVLYLLREALINVEKHANAQSVSIESAWSEHSLTIRLVDDGQGFAPDAAQSYGHLGLAVMRERAQEINAHLDITSRPGRGTQLMICIPFHPKK